MAPKRHMQYGLDAAPRQIRALAGLWHISEGHHPSLARHLPELAQIPVFPTDERGQLLQSLGLPVSWVSNGHHMVSDATYLAASGGEDAFPLAPVFVRDLCGRVIHTGLTPLAAPPAVPLFPSGCADVTADVAGADLIENAVFLSLRRLECAPLGKTLLAGQPDYSLQTVTTGLENTPYRLRIDTFYADGWRLPQLARVFARPVPQTEAQQAGEEFMQRWQSRPSGQGYETFYENNNGATWFESLFLRGCTVIPTFEACNGRYHVDNEYRPTEVDPGRAVPGLHVVAEERASSLPKGTILDVLEPGWVMQTIVNPAKVVVSDGSGFINPEAPTPHIPNLNLAHPRASSVWGNVWLPTHPQHFAEPALWDWSETGHFVQVSGPLWDPLHYIYTSTQPLLRAMRHPIEGNPYLYRLPANLKERFHPVTVQTWFDVTNERTAQQRQENSHHPLHGSALDSVLYGKPIGSVGYNPLPVALNYEDDPALFPILNPCHQTRPCPDHLEARIMPIAIHNIPAAEIRKCQVILSEGMKTTCELAAQPGQSDGLASTGPVWLPHIASSELLINVKRLFAQRTYRQNLQTCAESLSVPTLPASFYRFQEAALAWRRLRYRLFTKYAGMWHKAWQSGLDLSTAETMLLQGDDTSAAAVQLARRHMTGVSPVPPESAPRLPSPYQKGKLPRDHIREKNQ